jgi:outer membrane protein OmpA-like peptidoglycan-associated protein
LRQERDDLQHVLEAALSRVAEVTESVRGTIVNLPGILFDVSKSTLKPGSQVAVAKLAGILLVYQNATLEIEGHTDSTGTEATNKKLSEARAKAVYDFLQAQGIDASRMKYAGLGPQNPLATNDTPEGRAKNRRVEVVIAGVVKAAPQE